MISCHCWLRASPVVVCRISNVAMHAEPRWFLFFQIRGMSTHTDYCCDIWLVFQRQYWIFRMCFILIISFCFLEADGYWMFALIWTLIFDLFHMQVLLGERYGVDVWRPVFSLHNWARIYLCCTSTWWACSDTDPRLQRWDGAEILSAFASTCLHSVSVLCLLLKYWTDELLTVIFYTLAVYVLCKLRRTLRT